MVMRIRTGDLVQVMVGDDKGTRGKILRVDRKNGKVIVEGVNRAYKHVKRGHPKSPNGGRLSIELPIQACNVMLIDPTTDKPTRFRIRPAEGDQPKALIASKSKAVIREVK